MRSLWMSGKQAYPTVHTWCLPDLGAKITASDITAADLAAGGREGKRDEGTRHLTMRDWRIRLGRPPIAPL